MCQEQLSGYSQLHIAGCSLHAGLYANNRAGALPAACTQATVSLRGHSTLQRGTVFSSTLISILVMTASQCQIASRVLLVSLAAVSGLGCLSGLPASGCRHYLTPSRQEAWQRAA